MDSIDLFLNEQKQKVNSLKQRLTLDSESKRKNSNYNQNKLLIKEKLNNETKLLISNKAKNKFEKNETSKASKLVDDDDDHDDCYGLSLKEKINDQKYEKNVENDVISPFRLYDKLVSESGNKRITDENLNEIKPTVSATKWENGESNCVGDVETNENEMEPWVTEQFYSYFPSFGEQQNKKQLIAQALKQDYNNYLQSIAKLEPKDSKRTKNNRKSVEETTITTTINQQKENFNRQNQLRKLELPHANLDINKISPRLTNSRNKLLEDLKHTDLPNIFYTNAIQERNKQIVDEKNRKKMEYQRDLIKQIDEKKREIEVLRAKEKEEEELLTKKLEEQLRTMQLEEELSKEKANSDRARITNEQNHLFRMHLLSKLENDHKIYNPYIERKAQSENGKDLLIEQKPYTHFTNSAPHNYSNNGRHSSVGLINISNTENLHTQSDNPDNHFVHQRNHPYCRRCRNHENQPHDNDRNCIVCNSNFDDHRNILCNNCKQQSCSNCRNHDKHRSNNPSDLCQKCRNRNEINDQFIEEEDEYDSDVNESGILLPANQIRQNRRVDETRAFEIKYMEPNPEYDLAVNPIVIRNDGKPFSMNLPTNSVFNSNRNIDRKLAVNVRNGEVSVSEDLDELNRSIDQQFAKYAKNYDDLRRWRYKRIKHENPVDSFPVPLLRYDGAKSTNYSEGQVTSKGSENYQNSEAKWMVPAVQKLTMKTKPIRVFTQLGAIRKQLQMEQLNFE